MMHKIFAFATLLTLASAATAIAQPATTVQLPEFSFSTVNTTVTAPDRGRVSLGGISRLAEGSTERGVPLLGKVPGLNRLFKNRGIGRETSNSNYSVIPRIIILEEEEALQVGDPATYGTAFGPSAPKSDDDGLARYYYDRQNAADFTRAAALTRQIRQQRQQPTTLIRAAQSTSQTATQPSTAETNSPAAIIEARNAQAAATRSAEAVAYFEKANLAAAEGKKGAAKIYYRMAARRASGEYREEILQAMEELLAAQ